MAGSNRYSQKTGASVEMPPFYVCAPGMARSARIGAVNRGAKANREVTWRCKSSGGLGDRNRRIPNGAHGGVGAWGGQPPPATRLGSKGLSDLKTERNSISCFHFYRYFSSTMGKSSVGAVGGCPNKVSQAGKYFTLGKTHPTRISCFTRLLLKESGHPLRNARFPLHGCRHGSSLLYPRTAGPSRRHG